jgi:hypothetical protein
MESIRNVYRAMNAFALSPLLPARCRWDRRRVSRDALLAEDRQLRQMSGTLILPPHGGRFRPWQPPPFCPRRHLATRMTHPMFLF